MDASMTDQHDKDSEKKGQRKVEKRLIETPDYTGPDRRKTERRVIDENDSPQE